MLEDLRQVLEIARREIDHIIESEPEEAEEEAEAA